ncbi:MAG: oligosaccharide flippase family protein [Desulfobacteraceae bacterium]|nr:oligosaccharide flippase family protein [Desulfobacteraceae bacterium]
MKQYFKKSIIKRLVEGGIWVFLTKVGSGFLTIILTALVTRMLPPRDVGLFFLSFSAIMILSLFSRFGLDQLGIKLIGKGLAVNDLDSVKHLALRIVKFVCGTSLVFALLIIFSFDYFSGQFIGEYYLSSLFKLLFSAWMIVATIQILFSEIFRSFHRIGCASVYAGGTAFGGFGAGLLVGGVIVSFHFLQIKLTVEYLLAIIVAATSFFLIIEIVLIVQMLQFKGFQNKSQGNVKCVKYNELISQGFYFFAINLSIITLAHADIIILGFYQPEEEVAIYAATTRLVKLLTISLTVIYEVVAPVVVELNVESKKDQLQRVLRVAATIAAIPTSVILILFMFQASELLAFLYGDFYRKGVTILIILSCGQLVNVWSGLSSYTLSITGHHKINMYIVGCVATMATACCLFFVKEHGATAVASIISLAWIIQNIVIVLITRRLVGVWTPAGVLFCLKEWRRFYSKKRMATK